MKLKGRNAKNLKPKQRNKMNQTLKRMENTRKEDDKCLRDILNNRLMWAVSEKQKGLKKLEDTKAQILRLEGIIIIINDILHPEKKKEEPKK